MATQFTSGRFSSLSSTGDPLVGGLLYTYVAGTTNAKTTWSNSALTTANANPVVLDSRGEAIVWWGTGSIRMQLRDANNVVIWDEDNIPAISADADTLRTDLASSADAAKGDALIGVKRTPANAVATTLHKWIDRASVSAFDFMTDAQIADVQAGTAGVDVAAAIQAAINATTGVVFLPAGNYRLNTGLTWTKSDVCLIGQGEGATKLTATFATGDIITIGDGTANPNNSSVERLTINGSVARTSGAAIRFRNGHNLRISRIRLDSNHFWGFQFDGGAQQFLYYADNFEINAGSIGIIVGTAGTLVQDLWLDTGIVANTTGDGILLKHVSGWYFTQIDLLKCGAGIVSFPDTGKQVVAGWAYAVIADTCNSHGWKVLTNGGTVAEWTLTACWGASCGVTDNGHGMLLDIGTGTIRGVSITGARCINNKGNGILILGGEDITITNPQCLANSTAASAAKHGIEIAGGVSQWSIQGGSCGAGGLFTTNNQGFGIFVNAGASNNYQIIGVNTTGNVTGGISDGGTGAAKHIYGNLGYVSQNKGSDSVAVGATSKVVNHGLAAAPIDAEIAITDTQSRAAVGINSVWVSNIGATSFQVNTNAAVATSPFTFGWAARIKGA